MELRQQLIAILAAARDDIRANMAGKGINASGRTSAAIDVRQDKRGIRLSMQGEKVAPWQTLEVGRAGGKVPQGFYSIIIQWTRDKGLQFSTEQERGTFAYFVARKIAREGTQRNRQHVDVWSTISQRSTQEIKKKINTAVMYNVQQAIRGNF